MRFAPGCGMMGVMDSCEHPNRTILWPTLRIAGVVLVVLAVGFGGLAHGARALGGVLVFFAAAHWVRRRAGLRTGCEIPGQGSPIPALLLAAGQAAAGGVLLFWPEHVLRILGLQSG